MMKMQEALERLNATHAENMELGGADRIELQHSKGKLTARERIDLLVDPGTFQELGSSVRSTGTPMDGKVRKSPCDGLVMGTGRVNGRAIALVSCDFTVFGGAIGKQNGQKYSKLLVWAAKWGIPFIWILDSSGGRLNEFDEIPGAGVDFWFEYQSIMLGSVPQLQMLAGPCVAGQAYCPNLVDFLVMPKGTGFMWLGGPRMTRAATGEDMISKEEEMGGAEYHMKYSGSCDVVSENDADGIEHIKKLLSYIPQNNKEKAPFLDTGDDPNRRVEELRNILPEDINAAYDIHDVIENIVDKGTFYETKKNFAECLITGFCRFGGNVTGIVANNPAKPGSCVEPDPTDKYYKFLNFLDCYNIPLVNLVDTVPFTSGDEWERKGILRHHGKLLYTYSVATIPKISVILRRAYFDAGAFAMGCTHGMGTDLIFAWPTAEGAVEAAEPPVAAVFKDEIEEDAYEGYLKRPGEKLDAFGLATQFAAQTVDELIHPADTRIKIIEALKVTESKVTLGSEKLPPKRKAHGTAPT